jgi:hypothetical protein
VAGFLDMHRIVIHALLIIFLHNVILTQGPGYPAPGTAHLPVVLRKCVSRIDMAYAKWHAKNLRAVRNGKDRNLEITSMNRWFEAGSVVFDGTVIWRWGRGYLGSREDWIMLQVDVDRDGKSQGSEQRKPPEWWTSAEGFALEFLTALRKVRT